MAGHATFVGKELFHHGNGSILKLWELIYGERQSLLVKFNYISTHLPLEKNFNQLKMWYTDPCNFLTKRALVSQPSTLAVAKETDISHYLNLSINSPTIVLPII